MPDAKPDDQQPPVCEGLSACQFCGGEAQLQPQQGNNPAPFSWDVFHHCINGFIRFSPSGGGKWTKADAVAAWEARTTTTPPALPDAERLAEVLFNSGACSVGYRGDMRMEQCRIRAELGHAHDFYADLIETAEAALEQSQREVAVERERFTMHTAEVHAWLSGLAQTFGLPGGDVRTTCSAIMDAADKLKAEYRREVEASGVHLTNALDAIARAEASEAREARMSGAFLRYVQSKSGCEFAECTHPDSPHCHCRADFFQALQEGE